MEVVLPFQESIESKSEALLGWKKKSWELFLKEGLPTKKHPAFRSLSMRELSQNRFHLPKSSGSVSKEEVLKHILPSSLHSHLVFLDGHLDLSLSDCSALTGLKISSLEEGFSSHSAFIQTRLQKSLEEEKDPFSLLNLALFPEGVFVYVPSNVSVSEPLQILYLTTQEAPSLTVPRVHIALGKGSSLSCVVMDEFLTQNNHWNLPSLDVFIDETAHFSLVEVPTSPFFTGSLLATVKRAGKLTMTSVFKGGIISRSNYLVELQGEGADVEINGLSLGKGSLASHIYGTVIHKAPHTRSMQRFKAVLEDRSKTSYSGKIFVEKEAQKTEAYQLHKTLLLSPHAMVVSEPNLEIGADDVKASHGSTISQLGASELLYFQTRGIDKETGTKLLLAGFCQEILEKIPQEVMETFRKIKDLLHTDPLSR